MKSKAVSDKVTSILIEDLSDLMEELSDEEAGACVGGLDITIPTELVSAITNPIVTVNVSVGALGQTLEVDNKPGGTARFRSDRNIKERFAAVDVQEILTKVATLPIETWNYKDQNPTIRHIGPMAQDFAATFSVGEDNRSINMVDANGVALAAIKALYQRLQEKDAEISAMRTELDNLKQQMLESKVQAYINLPTSVLSSN